MSPHNHRSSTPTCRIAVVGGGISGLAAAHRLIEMSRESGQPMQLTLFEASGRLGGVVETNHVAGYLVESAADSFITNKPAAISLCERLQLEGRLISTNESFRRSLVLRRGKPVLVPEGFMLLAPAKVWPVLRSPVFSPWGKLRMGLEYLLPRGKASEDESLAQFVRRRFGREALDRLVQPLVGGIYTSDPEKLSLKATMPRFLEMERTDRSLIRASRKQVRRSSEKASSEKPSSASTPSAKPSSGSGARYGLFASLSGGMTELVDALRSVIETTAAIRTHAAVTEIRNASESAHRDSPASERGQLYTLQLADGTEETFDGVVLAVPSPRAASLLSASDPPLAQALAEIEYASTAIVVSGHRLEDVTHPLDAFGLVIPSQERRNVLAVSFSSRKFPGRAPEGRVLLRTFVGGALQPDLLNRSDQELKQLVRDELRELLGVGGTEDFCRVCRHDRSMPQFHVGHVERIGRIRDLAQAHPGLSLAGNAYEGVGLPDCIASGEQAAEQVWSRLELP